MNNVFEQIELNPQFAWILAYPLSSLPVGSKGVQSSVLAILAGSETCEQNLDSACLSKLKVTLGAEMFATIRLQEDWFAKIRACFSNTNT